MKMINFEIQDSIAIITLDRGVTNALNLEVVTELSQAFQDSQTDPEVRGLVLAASNEKFFSIGFDIPQVFELSKDDFRHYYRTAMQMYMELFTLPKPVVAALTGHAIAGGCILALCCDYRLIAAGRKLMGLNEIKLGVPVPYLADVILQSLVGVRHSRQIVETGEFYESEELFQIGMVDHIHPLEDVLPKAIEKAQALGAMQPEAYRAIKANRTAFVESQILKHREEKEAVFIDCWYSEAARELLKKAMEKF